MIVVVNNNGRLDKDFLEKLNTETQRLYDNVIENAMSKCSSDRVRELVKDIWDRNPNRNTDEYKKRFTDAEHKEAYEVIMELISMGFG